MTEEQGYSRNQLELLKKLKNVGSDLWGVLGDTGAAVSSDDGALPVPAAKKAPNPMDAIWKTADETIDWTEALLYTRPRDGLTGPKLWGFYHRMAEKVLEGDMEAYVEVLTTLNPLGDLTDYVNGMLLRAPGAERLECEFECRPEEIEKDARGYLGALSVRIARDLLAVLPVEEVHVLGRMNGNDQLDVTFRRSQMLKRKMAFLIPADFVEECGGRLEG